MTDIDLLASRDPLQIIAGLRYLFDGQRVAIVAGQRYDAATLAATQRQLILAERLVRRLRLVATMPEDATDEDWRGVEAGVKRIDRRAATVPGGISL